MAREEEATRGNASAKRDQETREMMEPLSASVAVAALPA